MRYQICVSGAASGETVQEAHDKAYIIGREIAKSGCTLTTGATVGLPLFAAMGFKSYKSARGVSAGFSPASSFREHVAVYRLPTMEFDYINFTGMAYVGRDVHLVRSSDAVITVGGRMGSLHEFSTALESHKVCGVLLGSGGLADQVQDILTNIWAPNLNQIVYEADPIKLVAKVIAKLDDNYKDFKFNDEADDSQVSPKRYGGG